MLFSTIIQKIFETNCGFHVKQRLTGKIQFLFFSSFGLVLKNFFILTLRLGISLSF